MINLTKNLFALWTRELLRWLSRKFDSISIDLTPVEDKLDEIKGDMAQQGDNPDATNTEILKAIENIEFPEDITVEQQEVVYAANYAALLLIEHPSESVLYITEDTGYMYKYRNGEFLLIENGEQVDNTLYFSSTFTNMSNTLKTYREQGSWEIIRVYSSKVYLYNFINTVTATRIQQKIIEDDLNAVKTRYRLGSIKSSGSVSWGAWVERTALYKEDLQGAVSEIKGVQDKSISDVFDELSHIDIDTSDLAKETQVKDGNDTAISVSKSVYGVLTDNTNGLSAIKNAIPTVANIQNGLATSSALSSVAIDAGNAASDAAAAKTAAQAITGYALQGNDTAATNTAILQAIPNVSGLATETNATANKNAIIAEIQANAGIPTLTIPDSTASQELAPNVLYVFDNRTSRLTLTLGTPIVSIANEYHFFVICGATAPTIIFPSGITWNGGAAPNIIAGTTYEISILNNVAAYFRV